MPLQMNRAAQGFIPTHCSSTPNEHLQVESMLGRGSSTNHWGMQEVLDFWRSTSRSSCSILQISNLRQPPLPSAGPSAKLGANMKCNWKAPSKAQAMRPCSGKDWYLTGPQNQGRPRPVWEKTPRSFLFLVVRPGAPSSVLVPSSDARSPY